MIRVLATSDIHRGFSGKTHEIHEKWAERCLTEIEFDVLVLAGDIGTCRQDHVEGALRWARGVADERPVLWSRGNHDLWDKKISDLNTVNEKHKTFCERYQIHHLQQNAFTYEDVLFLGWDGWYMEEPRGTNDFQWMPAQCSLSGTGTDEFLRKAEQEALSYVIDYAELAEKSEARPRTTVGVTHFPCFPGHGDDHFNANPRHLDFLKEYLDVLIFGHTHRAVDKYLDGVRLVSAGSDYDVPRAVLLEV